jgi:N-formylglutamate deformylase
MNDDVFTLHRGSAPLLISTPHAGTEIPDDVARQLVPRALQVEDADWHVERLYAFARELGASILSPRYARYVVDLNRPPENTPMYPGQNNTELVPTRFFTGEPLYREGRAPDEAEVQRRIARYWRPYHDALAGELQRLKSLHGRAMLFDGHSIQQELPWLFEGRLPELNVGTAGGTSCAPGLRGRFVEILGAHGEHTHAVDGRFKGGYITRHYGRPAENVHAVQMEMCWHCYLAEPHEYDESRAARVQPVLKQIAETLIAWQPTWQP